MSKNTTAYFTKEGRVTGGTIATGTTSTIFTADATNGSKLLKVLIVANPTGSYILKVNNGSDIQIYSNAAPAAGDDVLNLAKMPVDKNGNNYINLAAGSTAKITAGGGGTLTYFAYGEDY